MFLTAGSRTAYSRGFIYNIVTNDTDAVQLTCNQIFSVISSPLRIIVAMVLLYSQLGAAAFAALALLICMIPAQARATLHLPPTSSHSSHASSPHSCMLPPHSPLCTICPLMHVPPLNACRLRPRSTPWPVSLSRGHHSKRTSSA